MLLKRLAEAANCGKERAYGYIASISVHLFLHSVPVTLRITSRMRCARQRVALDALVSDISHDGDTLNTRK